MTLNDHMMETDEPVSVLICLDVYYGRQDRKLVKDKQNKQIRGPPYTPVTLPIMCKCMFRKSLRNITCNTALKDKVISYLKQIMFKTFSQV